MQIHTLKTWPVYYRALADGSKTFEVRRNDRDFAIGDVLELREWDPETAVFTGREMGKVVSYVLRGGSFGIDPAFCVLGLRQRT
jgi:hypothetical protein